MHQLFWKEYSDTFQTQSDTTEREGEKTATLWDTGSWHEHTSNIIQPTAAHCHVSFTTIVSAFCNIEGLLLHLFFSQLRMISSDGSSGYGPHLTTTILRINARFQSRDSPPGVVALFSLGLQLLWNSDKYKKKE